LRKYASRDNIILGATVLVALSCLVSRAWIQSLTIDEADTYLVFVARTTPSHWVPAANNHVLNSLLMRLFTTVFGPSAFTMRLPALLGGLLYITSVLAVVRHISGGLLLRWSLTVCLIFSPFVMDYLVAARGYGLAVGFLMGAVAIGVEHMTRAPAASVEHESLAFAFVSGLLALSFCANFSFAIADGSIGLAFFLWTWSSRGRAPIRQLIALTLPGAAVAILIVGPVVASWPTGELNWGAKSIAETCRSVMRASLFEPNPYFLNSWVHFCFEHVRRFLFPLLGVAVTWRLAIVIRGLGAVRSNTGYCSIGLASVSAGAAVATILVHVLLHRIWGVLLPLDRTALYLFPLFFLFAGSVASVGVSSRMGAASARAMTGMLLAFACYFLGCLRLTYFQEWEFDADVKNVYQKLVQYNRAVGLKRVAANWRYQTTLNCYRSFLPHGTLEDAAAGTAAGTYPKGFEWYVIYLPTDEAFVDSEKLTIVYHDSVTHVAIAIGSGLGSIPQ